MITLGDIFTDLTVGELNQFAVTGGIDAPVGITPKDYPMLINAINLGLTDLHSKLNLREREVAINTHDELSYYTLDSKYSVLNTDPTVFKYIQDSVDYPFLNDVIQIRAVWDECGEKVPMNDDNSNCGVYLVNYRTIQYPNPQTGVSIVVTYQANHPRISTDAGLDTEVMIPEYLRELLYAFVVNRVLMRSQGADAVNVAAFYKSKYDMGLSDVRRYNLLNIQDNTMSNRFYKNGWL